MSVLMFGAAALDNAKMVAFLNRNLHPTILKLLAVSIMTPEKPSRFDMIIENIGSRQENIQHSEVLKHRSLNLFTSIRPVKTVADSVHLVASLLVNAIDLLQTSMVKLERFN